MSTSIGMMDPAYFVGRKEILEWLNGYLGLNLQKVEETCTGAVACQLIDSLFPAKVPMSKVNWEAKTDAEYIQNYKVLQSAFDRLHIEKHIDVQRLIRGKYMDNLEFMQWFKNFHDTTGAAGDYDPIERRSKGKGGTRYGVSGSRRPSSQAASRTSRPVGGGGASFSTKGPGASQAIKARRTRVQNEPNEQNQQNQQLQAKVDVLTQEREELVASVAAVEKERDFYFDKLREIEVLMQNHEQISGESDLTKDAFKILYATDDEQKENIADGEGDDVLDAFAGQSDDLLADDGHF